MTTEQIKWCVGKAEGFTLHGKHGRNTIFTPCGAYAFTFKNPLDSESWTGAGSLLLQRAIEGVNRKYYCEGSKIYPWLILTTSHGFRVYKAQSSAPSFTADYDWPCSSKDIDSAKLAALMYVMDKEMNG